MIDVRPTKLRFSLRTLFALLTIAAVISAWVAYSLNWIEQRLEFLNSKAIASIVPGDPAQNALPLQLRLFGAQSVDVICFYEKQLPTEELEKAKSLFPETKLVFDFWNQLIPGLGDDEPPVFYLKSKWNNQSLEDVESRDHWGEEPVDLLKPPAGEGAFPK